jgi:polyphosphate kinase
MDFIFVDGCHTYEYVKNDSERAFKMRSKRGIIVWHDYSSWWPEVMKYLNELSREKNIFAIRGTSFAFFKP